MRRAGALALAALLLAAVQPAAAQAPPTGRPKVDETTQLFCKGDSGDIEFMKYASLGTVMRRYAERFAFSLSLDGALRSIKFSNDQVPYFITYETQPYTDDTGRTGLALLSMHLSLENLDEVVTGTTMCYFTQQGK